ncbi:hypothetical protein [bacterium endosymbiont of Bathymodiolus sp. 5 South]|uniref:hypothetical protein n=1 Tax=bacterium endosymbiont of Bathymodiolus sp. 5 South TaxID=1181670 RepID=UPI0011194E74|nr:hypothetical protein [bacterium endosymbiont of Bathymodiolus sp. 5 South]VVH63308.1 hypothetical protein BSPWISOX_134 [uncultured Gammaproteobacteria bacterium]VVM17595.1 hypothetical protein BSPWISOXPB_2962 [uncultured Gammaproteobacteria bacterium]VVM21293.1 hypothetical protein BSPWISOXPB_7472 [uncultured Gammaproteobacteria bacterium]VVM25408.1 hypothetical protein BSPWISOXPB_2753 [uncultured Gammaproteobacteria bacterium]VVM25990.1 hypothetical protein BSPWISOXPB_7458 [uncultured Gamm
MYRNLCILQAFDKLPDISTTKTYGQVFADSTYTNKNKQTTSIQTFLENIFEKFNNWNESEKQKIML